MGPKMFRVGLADRQSASCTLQPAYTVQTLFNRGNFGVEGKFIKFTHILWFWNTVGGCLRTGC
jgi:hypothetical protein